MNDENLVSLATREQRERTEIARKGKIASDKVKKQKKLMRDIAPLFLQAELDSKTEGLIKGMIPILGEDKSIQASVIAGQAFSAMQGNTKAFEKLLQLQEDSVKEEEQRNRYTMPITDITVDYVEAYREIHEALESGKWREFIFKGGRGSIKSNFISGIAEEIILNDKQAHVVFTRRYKTDLRGSVYNQFLKTITRHGTLDEWEFTTSPMMAKYKKTGQCVIFVGCDKPISLKSYNLSFGYVAMVVNEECDEMAGIEQIDNVEDTFLRADTHSISVKCYNPPKSVNNWMNQYTAESNEREKCFVSHSYYFNVPVKWLGKRFFERAEWFKNHKPLYYKNNYLGEVTGTGGTIFENLEERTITDEEIQNLPRYYGLDFGYVHPQAFIECAYDSNTGRLYPIHEVRKVKIKQTTFAKHIKDYKNVEIIADSANPDKIQDYRDFGFDIIGATKRWKGGGRDYAWEWLQTRSKIIVDPERTPFLAKEMRKAEHEQLRDGSFSSAYPSLEEDCIMAMVYGLNRVIMDEKSLDDYEDAYRDDDEEEEI